jgi:glycosyltransferase involved in cell wall biosynthesis
VSRPEIAISITTYQQPDHLRRVLASVAVQRDVAGLFEVVVTDDGSTDETPQVVEQFRRSVSFPVAFTTHRHTTFHPGRCRNEGAAATTAPYLLFVDGDCVLPPDHVRVHLDQRQPGCATLGYCYRLDEETSRRLTEEVVRSGQYLHWDYRQQRRRLWWRDRKMRFYNWLGYPTKSKLAGGNVGVWRSDFELVNGFDENFAGWGQEDDDLGRRLQRAGVRLTSVLRWTHTYHLWHPVDPSKAQRWREGPNVPYFLRRGRLTRCRNGLVKRRLEDLSVCLAGQPRQPDAVASLLRPLKLSRDVQRPEVELLILPGEGRFSRQADCRVLLVLDETLDAAKLARQADIVVAPHPIAGCDGNLYFSLGQLGRALEAIC